MSLAPPTPRHDCPRSMVFAHDVCWCEICLRTWTMGPRSWELVTGSMAQAVRSRALRERSAS